jgi:hypothetical protein
MTYKFFSIILTAVCLSASCKAQSAEDSIRYTINEMFTAMRTADTNKLKNCFSDSVILQTIYTRGKVRLRNDDKGAFISFVGNVKPGEADERISFGMIKVDGPLASVWTPYEFHYKGKFSHCGVNSFQLMRYESGWKIIYLVDTRRVEDCARTVPK